MLSRNRAQQLAIEKTTVLLPNHYPGVISDSPSSTITINIPLSCLTLSQGIFCTRTQNILIAIPSSYLLRYNLGQEALSLKHFAAVQVYTFCIFASLYYLSLPTTGLLHPHLQPLVYILLADTSLPLFSTISPSFS